MQREREVSLVCVKDFLKKPKNKALFSQVQFGKHTARSNLTEIKKQCKRKLYSIVYDFLHLFTLRVYINNILYFITFSCI